MKNSRKIIKVLLVVQLIICLILIVVLPIIGKVTGEAAAKNANTSPSGIKMGHFIVFGIIGVCFMILGAITLINIIFYFPKKKPSFALAVETTIICNPIIGILMIREYNNYTRSEALLN
ncbi:MAG: hypothetical protein K6A63_06350 [Acholeplasmatales bacterium]|nr:hypothetical protein [Acholeplasmatales bacterium]